MEHIENTHGYSAEGLQAFARMRPLCTLDAGRAFVVGDPYAGADDMWVPASCGAQAAYVHVTDSLFRAVVFTDSDGTARLVQVLNVECDSAELETWRYTRDGREPVLSAATRYVASAGCGGLY